MKRNATTYLTREEIKAFVTPTDRGGVLSVVQTWMIIGLTFVLLWKFNTNPLAWIAAVIVLGGQQLALAILMHECSHHALFATRSLNDHLGKWLCAAPVWQRLDAYRKHHLAHHGRTSLEGDPDLGLVEPFPSTRGALFRKCIRDIVGLTFVRRTVGLLLMDAGFLTYSASTGSKRVVPRPSAPEMAANLAKNFGPVVITNLALSGVLVAVGHGYLYTAWILGNATAFSLFVRLRAIAEHALTQTSDDPFLNTRTTRANWLARLTVAPHHVNYHLEHHLLPTAPHYNLSKIHARLREVGAYDEAQFAKGYLEVMRAATTPPKQAQA